MFTFEMVEDTYGILTDSGRDFVHIDTAVAMTLDTFGFNADDDGTIGEYHKYYVEVATEVYGTTGAKY